MEIRIDGSSILFSGEHFYNYIGKNLTGQKLRGEAPLIPRGFAIMPEHQQRTGAFVSKEVETVGRDFADLETKGHHIP